MNKIMEVRPCTAGLCVGQRNDKAAPRSRWVRRSNGKIQVCRIQDGDIDPKGQTLVVVGTEKEKPPPKTLLFFLRIKHR